MRIVTTSASSALLLVLCATLLSGCTGSSNSYSLPAPVTSQAESDHVPSSSAASAHSSAGSVSIAIEVTPKKTSKRSPHYVSPSSKSLQILTDGGSPIIVNLTPSSPNCSPAPSAPGSYICKAALSVPSGNHTFTLTAYDAVDAKGNVLSTNSTGVIFVKPSGTTTISVVLEGVVQYVLLQLGTSNPTEGTATAIPLTVLLEDADHNLIVGPAPFDHPVTLTTSDQTNGPLSKSSLTSPADASNITADYDGANVAPITYSATATGLPAANVTTAVLTPSAPGPQLSTLITAVNDVSSASSDRQAGNRATYHSGYPPASRRSEMLAYKLSKAESPSQRVRLSGAGSARLLPAAAAATYHGGAPPASQTANTATATRSGQNFDGESSVYNVTGSAPFSDVIVAVAGFAGYYELPVSSTQSENISLTFAQVPPVTSFNLLFAIVTGPSSLVGTYESVASTVSSQAGTGAIQVNLSWNAPVDLDLHVVDPLGNEVFWGARDGYPNSTGGHLDIDSNAGCDIDNIDSENITWPAGAPPAGTYTVRVDEWDSCNVVSAIPFTVTINVQGQTQKVYASSFAAGLPGDQGYIGSGTTIATFSTAPCTLTSETVATVPSPRTRTLIGVGEQVNITSSDPLTTWQLSGPGTLSSTSGATVTYTAGTTNATPTITATGASCSPNTISFNVIQPTGIVDMRVPGTGVRHSANRPDIGMELNVYLQPSTVSFKNVQFLESDVGCICTGVYAPFNGQGHGPNPNPLQVGDDVPGLGSQLIGTDTVYSGDPGTPAPFAPGSEIFNIPTNFVLAGSTIDFTTAVHHATLAPDGNSLSITKAGASASTTVNAGSSSY